MIYLFIYSKRCQQKQVEAMTCFYLLMVNIFLLDMVFILIFSDLFIYLFKVVSTKAGGSDDLFLFTYANRLVLTHGFHVVVAVQSKPTHFYRSYLCWLGIGLLIKGDFIFKDSNLQIRLFGSGSFKKYDTCHKK